jgi:DNA polymerase-3 subunit epsilon
MHFNIKQLYTPALEIHELNERALIIDTETLGTGPTTEIIEIALGDIEGRIVFESLVQPVFNPLPPALKDQRFTRTEFLKAPDWRDLWPAVSSMIDGKVLVAYNAAFDRRALAAMCSRHHQTSTESGWRCAMQLVKSVLRSRRPINLSQACAHYGVEAGNHRAARDVQATAHLLLAVLARAA